MKVTQEQSDLIDRITDYLQSIKKIDVNSPYRLMDNLDKAQEIISDFFEESDNKLKRKKASALQTGFDKILKVIQNE